jgi:hypothetical protein
VAKKQHILFSFFLCNMIKGNLQAVIVAYIMQHLP